MDILYYIYYRAVEQLEARRAHNPKVAGSSPVGATKSLCIAKAFFVLLFSVLIYKAYVCYKFESYNYVWYTKDTFK